MRRGNPGRALAAARAFAAPTACETAVPYGSGHINDTWLVSGNGQDGPPARFVLQELNTAIFRQPERLMENVERVTRHLAGKHEEAATPDAARRVLRLVPAGDGRSFWYGEDGSFWRAFRFIDGARSWDVLTSPSQAYEAARAFALFQQGLADLPGPRLHETIPAFHDTPRRLEQLLEAVRADACGRARDARREIDGLLARAGLASALAAPLADGRLAEGIAHNDTKLNNVLLDEHTGEGICVIDLDTVMPGLFLHDFGDMVRTACNPVAEDEPDASRVVASVPMFAALAQGTLEVLGGSLTPFERESLPLAGRLLTFEVGCRFLADHLAGDVYFPARRPGHNLDRARTQLALLASLEAQDEALHRAVEVAGVEAGAVRG